MCGTVPLALPANQRTRSPILFENRPVQMQDPLNSGSHSEFEIPAKLIHEYSLREFLFSKTTNYQLKSRILS